LEDGVLNTDLRHVQRINRPAKSEQEALGV